ncbi:unnamed protein product [Agarophyton chilense]|eukprot:gb/GEZJ01003258.1/.p1 GENE.gb/GEZJ01003258.1/~~gb/GEZJ01003258.1/.p1  ORF type:complete len:610 (-),score=86.80 gb/GEZJ01003258.1/:1764-3593(-)
MNARLSFLLALFLPVVLCFPARPFSNVLHPTHIHQIFLRLKARRVRLATVRFAAAHLLRGEQLQVVDRVGLAFEPCVASTDCLGERTCSQLAGSVSGAVGLVDCAGGLCFCSDTDGCSSTADCLEGETCAPGGTCVSNSFVPGASPPNEADPSLGLNLDPCKSISDCQNPRNCVQYVEGVFGQCSGANCFCVRPDPSCTSPSECSQGESCTQREGANNAICISESAIVSGDAMEEEIDEIKDSTPDLPSMTDMPITEPLATAIEETAAPLPSQASPVLLPSPSSIPLSVPLTPSDEGTPEISPPEAGSSVEEGAAPVTSTGTTDGMEGEPATEGSPVASTGPTDGMEGEPATEGSPVASTGPTDGMEGEPATEGSPVASTDTTGVSEEPTVVAETEETSQPEQVDNEPTVVLPGADGVVVSPDSEQGVEVLPTDDAGPPQTVQPAIIGDPDVVSSPPPEELEGIDPSVSPEVGEQDDEASADGSSADGTSPDDSSPDEAVCIGEHHLVHIPRDQLLYSSSRFARVLCDSQNSCATPGHIVMVSGKPMMMRSYCAKTTCAPRIMKVNSPRYKRAARVDSHTDGLIFTAFAARYESTAEEHLLRTFVHIGL